jgi:hypothetical protein
LGRVGDAGLAAGCAVDPARQPWCGRGLGEQVLAVDQDGRGAGEAGLLGFGLGGDGAEGELLVQQADLV